MFVRVAAITDSARDSAITLAQVGPPSASATYTSAEVGVGLELGRRHHSLQAQLRQRVDDGQQDDRRMAARPGLMRRCFDLLVDVQGAFPATEDEHREEQPAGEAAVPADAAEAEPALGDRERCRDDGAAPLARPTIANPMRIMYSTAAMPTCVRAVMRIPTIAITSMSKRDAGGDGDDRPRCCRSWR